MTVREGSPQSYSQMSFISNAEHVTLGDGMYNNIQGDMNIVHHNYYGTKRHREAEIEGRFFLSNKAAQP